MGPMKTNQIVSLVIQVANAGGLLVRSVRNLVMILAQGSDPAELVAGGAVIQQRKEPARSAFLIVKHLRYRRAQAQVGAVSVHAGVIRQPLGVPADIELIVGGIEVAGRGDDLG